MSPIGLKETLRIRAFIALGAGFVIAGLAATAMYRGKEASLSGDRGPAALRQAPRFEYRPEPGYRYTYHFKRSILFQGMAAPKEPIAYSGELSIDVLKSSEQGFEAVVSQKVTEVGQASPVLLKANVSLLGDQLLLFYDGQSDSVIEQHISVMKDLLSQFVFKLSTDTVGDYRSNFTLDGAVLKKSKENYLDSSEYFPEVLRSEHSMSWNEELRLPAAISGSEVTRISATQVQATSQYDFQFQSRNPSDRTIIGITHHRTFNHTLGLKLSDQRNSMKDNPEFSRLSFALIKSELRDLDSMNSNERLSVFGDLINALRSQKMSVEEALSLIDLPQVIAQGGQSELYKVVVGALASLGTREAQTSLVKIYQDPNAVVSGKGAILTALSTTQAQLSNETHSFLVSQYEDRSNPSLSEGAAFALSSGAKSSPEILAETQALIRENWSKPSLSVSEQRTLLDMMGNSGDPSFVTEIGQTLNQASDPSLRAKAVFALRLMESPAAVSLISASLSDPDPRVREAAVEAMGVGGTGQNRSPAQFAGPLQSCGRSEPNPVIRKACLDLTRRI